MDTVVCTKCPFCGSLHPVEYLWTWQEPDTVDIEDSPDRMDTSEQEDTQCQT